MYAVPLTGMFPAFLEFLFFVLESKGVDVAVKYSTSMGKVHIHVPDVADLI